MANGDSVEAQIVKRSRGAARRTMAAVKDAKIVEMAKALTLAYEVITSLELQLDGTHAGSSSCSELAVRLVAQAPHLAALLSGQRDTPVDQLRRNVAAHAKVVGTGAALLLAPAAQLRAWEKGPRLGSTGGAGRSGSGSGSGSISSKDNGIA